MSKEFQEQIENNNNLGLSEEEIAFYYALATDEIKAELEDCEVLKAIARELTKAIKNNLRIDWYEKESSQDTTRKTIKRLLKNTNTLLKGKKKL